MKKIMVITDGHEIRYIHPPPYEHAIYIEGAVDVSDGYHTFSELYEHRHALFIALCRSQVELNRLYASHHGDRRGPIVNVWKSKQHSDGTMFDEQFIMGLSLYPGNQITYHLPLSLWEETNFAQTFERAPEWDGHMPKDVIDRLKNL
jgi:hypothetical protein